MRGTKRYGLLGFTLIELLVVIAIIAILAAILFPVFTAAQRSAMMSWCVGNEKQILAAICLYAQDTGGKAPLGYDNVPAQYSYTQARFGRTWADRILAYTKNKDVFICPAVPKSMYRDLASARFFKWDANSFPTHYGMNWRMTSGGGLIDGTGLNPWSTGTQLAAAGIFATPVVLEAVRRPSKTVLIAESQHMAWRVLDNKGGYASTFAAGGGRFVFSDNSPNYWQIRWLKSPYLPQGHGNGANFGFVDGHVSFVTCVDPDTSAPSGPGKVPDESPIAKAGLTWWD